MKKFLAIAIIAATLTSCGGGDSKEGTTEDTMTNATTPATETPAVQDDTTTKAGDDTTAKAAEAAPATDAKAAEAKPAAKKNN